MTKVVRPWTASCMRLDGKIAVIIGSGGLGRPIAVGYADAGAEMVVADLSAELAEATAREVTSMGKRAFATTCDVSLPEESRRVVGLAVEKFGRVDILVNTAAIVDKHRSVDLTEEDWDRSMAVNLKGAFFCAQAAARAFISQGSGGKIITLTSHMGFVGSFLPRVCYATSKAGIINMTRALASEWAEEDINVNALAPIYTLTAFNEKLLADPAVYDTVMGRMRIKRLGQPEDIIGAAVYLASEASNFMTGQTMVVDGGWFTW